jgi:hypothetical protein
MRWRTIRVCAVSLLAMTGCPQEFGKHGRINKAIHKDLMERLQQKCSEQDIFDLCSEDMPLEECLKRCG